MNRIVNSTLDCLACEAFYYPTLHHRITMQLFMANRAFGVTTLPVRWTGGGLSAGTDSAG